MAPDVFTGLSYTFSTIAQSLAGGLAVSVAFVVIRLPALEYLIERAWEFFEQFEKQGLLLRTDLVRIATTEGCDALKGTFKELEEKRVGYSADQLALQCRFLRDAALKVRTVRPLFRVTLAMTLLDIGLCFVSLAILPWIQNCWLPYGLLILSVLLGVSCLAYFGMLIWELIGRHEQVFPPSEKKNGPQHPLLPR